MKKYNLTLFIIIFITFLLGCDVNDTNISYKAEDYFPLKENSEWIYVRERGDKMRMGYGYPDTLYLKIGKAFRRDKDSLEFFYVNSNFPAYFWMAKIRLEGSKIVTFFGGVENETRYNFTDKYMGYCPEGYDGTSLIENIEMTFDRAKFQRTAIFNGIIILEETFKRGIGIVEIILKNNISFNDKYVLVNYKK